MNGREASAVSEPEASSGLRQSLGLFDSTMIVAGSMIGAGIFIVPAEMARQVGSVGGLLTSWVITALLTVAAALSYGELAAMLPHAGGQYVYLREAWSPLCGFLYGWTLFLVIQTGTAAAVGVGFARYLGILWPRVSEDSYLIPPIHLTSGYAVSLSTAQLAGVLLIVLLTWANARGIQYGTLLQNTFTSAKLAALLGVIAVGVAGWRLSGQFHFSGLWQPKGYTPVAPGMTPETWLGLGAALCIAQVGSLFSADGWNNITFTAGEVKTPRRNVPLSLLFGALIVMTLYVGANVAYAAVLPLEKIQRAPSDRVAGAMLQAIFPTAGAAFMAIVIMISAFGCLNGSLLSGARAYFAMARDGLFFAPAGVVNRARVPGASLAMQGAWASCLVLIRTYHPSTRAFGNLYSNLLDYVVSADLLFYILTIAAVFRLRRLQPAAERPYRTWGYPFVPAFYILSAGVILAVLFVYRPATTFPGLVIVAAGVPIYFAFRRS
ncbi:MAG TPA: amino acid permease [Bryobacteraceae bacterium]|nr:amino acid permease [Bryobacteraceae bacterium]